MRTKDDLRSLLYRINGRGYKAYKDIRGEYKFEKFTLIIDHVQGDPFASPSRLRVVMPQSIAQIPEIYFSSKSREIALRDFLTRQFALAIKRHNRDKRGSGKSGLIEIDTPKQEILERTSAFITQNEVEVRFFVGLPAFGRRIAGDIAVELLIERIPRIVIDSLVFKNLNEKELKRHVETAENADFIREKLKELKLVAFIANNSILPRSSGIDPRPLKTGTVIPFKSPQSMLVTIELPNGGSVSGMGIREGVTLIVGGGFHGKSTLLNSIELGIYNHIPGDGREYVITRRDAVKIRAEDGRRIEKVDISPFIDNLPLGRDTKSLSTEDASGSTSQAANIIEAIEAGADTILIDEDTSATNFMIRDHRMQELISKDKEPITPFIDKVKLLYRDYGISTIIVVGGSGDYFDVADTVIGMESYIPHDLTLRAREIAKRYASERKREGGEKFGKIIKRIPVRESFNPSKGKRDVKIAAKGTHTIQFGYEIIDLSSVEQLVENSQTRAIGDAILYAMKYMDNKRTMDEILEMVERDIRERGLDVINRLPLGNYAFFRKEELAAAINRMRSLKIIQKRD